MSSRSLRWGSLIGGSLLVALGVLLLIDQAHALPAVVWRYWPVVLIAWGLWKWLERFRVREDRWAGPDYGTGLYVIRRRRRQASGWLPGLFLIVLGGVLLLSPYSNRLWSAEDQAFLTNIAASLVPIIQRGQKMSSLEVKSEQAKQALDELGAELPNAKHFIVVVDGNTDSTGSNDYNYLLSKRRADSVIHYLVTKYQLPSYKIYIIGLGKDKPVASNSSTAGRAKNRRVDVRLMTNINEEGSETTASASSSIRK